MVCCCLTEDLLRIHKVKSTGIVSVVEQTEITWLYESALSICSYLTISLMLNVNEVRVHWLFGLS